MYVLLVALMFSRQKRSKDFIFFFNYLCYYARKNNLSCACVNYAKIKCKLNNHEPTIQIKNETLLIALKLPEWTSTILNLNLNFENVSFFLSIPLAWPSCTGYSCSLFTWHFCGSLLLLTYLASIWLKIPLGVFIDR